MVLFGIAAARAVVFHGAADGNDAAGAVCSGGRAVKVHVLSVSRQISARELRSLACVPRSYKLNLKPSCIGYRLLAFPAFWNVAEPGMPERVIVWIAQIG